MLLKLGVSIARLNRPCRRALAPIDRIFQFFGFEAVITSTFEGSHSPSSLHYNNDAFDVRVPGSRVGEVGERIRQKLGKDFDVVLEGNHYHIEYDPKG